jgi:hypothetical protein
MERVIYVPERKVEAGWRFKSRKGNEEFFLYRDLTPSLRQDDLVKLEDVADVSTLFKLFEVMYDLNAEKGTEDVRQFIQDVFRTKYPSTSTRIAWMPKGSKDIIMQRYGTEGQTEKTINLIGSDGEVQKVLRTDACRALTGTTPSNVKKYLDWTNGTDYTGVWRFNSRPEQRTERVVRFYADSDGALLDCFNRFPADCYPALRVSRKKF